MEDVALVAGWAAFGLVWWWLNRLGKKREWKWWQRHPLGLFAGLIVLAVAGAAFLPVEVDLPAKESTAIAEKLEPEKPVEVEATTAALSAPAERAPEPEKPIEDVAALAKETLSFLIRGDQTLGYAIDAADGDAVRRDVQRPAFGLVMRWNNVGLENMEEYEACYEAAQAMHSYSGTLLREDSADRRRSLDYDSKAFYDHLPRCEAAVSSAG